VVTLAYNDCSLSPPFIFTDVFSPQVEYTYQCFSSSPLGYAAHCFEDEEFNSSNQNAEYLFPYLLKRGGVR